MAEEKLTRAGVSGKEDAAGDLLREVGCWLVHQLIGSFEAAVRFCSAHDELRDHLRSRKRQGEPVSLAEQRRLFRVRWPALLTLLAG